MIHYRYHKEQFGKVDNVHINEQTFAISSEEEEFNRIMSRFWQIEEVEMARRPLIAAEQRWEAILTETTTIKVS